MAVPVDCQKKISKGEPGSLLGGASSLFSVRPCVFLDVQAMMDGRGGFLLSPGTRLNNMLKNCVMLEKRHHTLPAVPLPALLAYVALPGMEILPLFKGRKWEPR